MKVRISRVRGRSFLVGVALLAVIGVCAYIALTAQSGPPFTSQTQVKAAFADVGQLSAGDDVRQNSVRIGQVSAIDYSNNEAVVTMELQDSTVYADARAAMWDQSALGQKFVELDPGSAASGPLGAQTIPKSRTASAVDIDQLLDVFDPKTRDATSSAVRELGTGVAGQSKALHEFLVHAPATLDGFGTIAGALASPDADLPALLGSAQRLAAQLSGRSAALEDLLQRTTTTLQAVNVDGAKPLSKVVASLPDTLADVRSVAAALRKPLADTQSAMTALGPGARSLGEATADLRAVLVNGVTPLHKVPGVADTAGPAVDDLTTTFSDARPLVPRLDAALASLNPFIAGLAPYSVDIPALANGGAGFADGRITDEKGVVFGFVRIFPVIAPGSAAGLLPQGYDPYPKPGTAEQDGAGTPSSLVGGGR